MNVNKLLTKDYGDWTLGQVGKTNPKRTQTNPNEPKTNPILEKPKMNLSAVITKNYEQLTMNNELKNKPNSNPIQSQFKPKQSQYNAKTNPIQTQFHLRPKGWKSSPMSDVCPRPSVLCPRTRRKKSFPATANWHEMSKEMGIRSIVLPAGNTKKLTIDKRVNMRENQIQL